MTPRRINANQVVAYNLRRVREEWARSLGHFTQEEAAQLLQAYTDDLWSKARFSAAERSYAPGTRSREFTANEIVAFAAAFQREIAYFFEPPNEDVEIVCDGEVTVSRTISPKQLHDLARPTDLAVPHLAADLRRVADALDPPSKRKGK